MFRVTRRYQFAASHRLHSPELGEQENRELYGKCNNPYGHGHNYQVEVSARGPVDESGLAVNTDRLDELVRHQVLEPMAYRNLNIEVPAFERLVPTTENLAVEICRRLKQHWNEAFPGDWPQLDRVRIAETERNIFEVKANEIL